MSQHIVSQKISRICDGCGEAYEYEYVGMAENPSLVRELEDWTQITRELWNGRDWVKMVAQAKGLDCVQKAATKMSIMIQAERDRQDKEEQATDGIDLDALRTASANSEPLAN